MTSIVTFGAKSCSWILCPLWKRLIISHFKKKNKGKLLPHQIWIQKMLPLLSPPRTKHSRQIVVVQNSHKREGQLVTFVIKLGTQRANVISYMDTHLDIILKAPKRLLAKRIKGTPLKRPLHKKIKGMVSATMTEQRRWWTLPRRRWRRNRYNNNLVSCRIPNRPKLILLVI